MLIDRFNKRLSTWKANLLSIGGHLTLVKSVPGSIGNYLLSLFKCPEGVINALESLRAKFFWGASEGNSRMHWVKWEKTLKAFDKGGLRIGSLRAFNQASLIKWAWHYAYNPGSKWVEVINSVHGTGAGINGSVIWGPVLWFNMVYLFRKAIENGKLPRNVLRRKIGDGHNTLFWIDNWIGDGCLKDKFNRLYHLDTHKIASCQIDL
ncbi:uncharacterized mitochondrial protein AtMg00310-like [Rutidosis leptorrhynchoides]|uniref:uncharacterized mitochondrial protein AtMg00310-like n=1 Tax=Rutidosis leptorrhynchoides TaxID=125765 RepID=UPI003A9A66B0